MIRITIVDDDPLVGAALKTILQADAELCVEAVGASGKEGIDLYDKNKSDVLLMDIRMPDMTGISAGIEILKKYPSANILFLTTFSDDEYIIEALRMGAKGYLIKQDFDHIIPAIKAVFSGQSVFGNEIVSRLPELMKKTGDFSSFDLNEKEKEIIGLVANGLSNKEIAERLSFSEGTIRNNLSTILEKLQLRDRTQLAVFYYKHGF